MANSAWRKWVMEKADDQSFRVGHTSKEENLTVQAQLSTPSGFEQGTGQARASQENEKPTIAESRVSSVSQASFHGNLKQVTDEHLGSPVNYDHGQDKGKWTNVEITPSSVVQRPAREGQKPTNDMPLRSSAAPGTTHEPDDADIGKVAENPDEDEMERIIREVGEEDAWREKEKEERTARLQTEKAPRRVVAAANPNDAARLPGEQKVGLSQSPPHGSNAPYAHGTDTYR
ncbi:hypothetical protein GGR56DRAFT_286373 [Xylariaceae sp. FL0804]|nr:hypothetical protein GGR56DRAFT_286373 [Xylariaceae sp. FL0804]